MRRNDDNNNDACTEHIREMRGDADRGTGVSMQGKCCAKCKYSTGRRPRSSDPSRWVGKLG
jgi:hypothetical protein